MAHVRGVLGQASLMVAGAAALDAVARAKRLPGLDVGLHVVVVDGDSVLGHAALPHITTADGKFGRNQVRLGFLYFFSHSARRELALEIRAQFAAFAAAGLLLHHADAHKHMQMHPTVAGLMMRIGKEFGLTRIRVPAEPPWVLQRCGERPGVGAWALYFWSFLLRWRARRAGLAFDDYVFGIFNSGRMELGYLRRLMAHLPAGACEIYTHPAVHLDDVLQALMPDYDHVGEFEALVALRKVL